MSDSKKMSNWSMIASYNMHKRASWLRCPSSVLLSASIVKSVLKLNHATVWMLSDHLSISGVQQQTLTYMSNSVAYFLSDT